MLLTAIARSPPDGVPEYLAYEDRVLPLLAEHGAALERRLRTADGTTEVHLVRFPSQAAVEAFIATRAVTAPAAARSLGRDDGGADDGGCRVMARSDLVRPRHAH